MRRFLDRIRDKSLSCLVTCDSWAWEFLTRALGASSFFPTPLTLAPFEGPALCRWFRGLSKTSRPEGFTFRQTDSGEPVLLPDPEPADPSEKNRKGDGDSEFLRQLAARSRGNPGVAWAIWRHSLLVSAQPATLEGEVRAAPSGEGSTTMWVTPWQTLDLPGPPGWAGKAEALVLHALLLHGGLTRPMVHEVLPFSTVETEKIVARLYNTGILGEEDGALRVTALGYPETRAFLSGERLFVDTL